MTMPVSRLLLSLLAAGLALVLTHGATAAPKSTTFRDCPGCPEMVALPAGSLLMGSPDAEPGRNPDEGPQRRIAIHRFAVGKFDVTRGQWAAFVAATKRPTVGGCAWASASGHRPDPAATWRHVDFPQDDDHPVVCVTFQDAQDYVAWLTRLTGHRYRLLSEAEWEYAARAGSTSAYFWGAEADHAHANYGAQDCCSGLAAGVDKWVQTSPVGSFPANAFGLHDMSGNVMSWLQDCMHDYRDAAGDGAAYETPGAIAAGDLAGTDACAYRMLRGGDWGNPPEMIRSATRNYAPAPGSTVAVYKSGGLSFRVARSLP